jgi:acyl carrier protein
MPNDTDAWRGVIEGHEMMDVTTVVEIARRALLDRTIGPASRLEDAAGYDSLTHLQFVLELEKKSGHKLSGDLAETATLKEVSALISARV